MTDSSDEETVPQFRLGLPSDFSDVQPMDYDPDFISDISNKMQIPDKLGARNDYDDYESKRLDFMKAHDMMVPDRIIVAGEGKHIGTKENLHLHDFDKAMPGRETAYVGLMTPPRTLTMEEQGFVEPPMDGEEGEEEEEEAQVQHVRLNLANGNVKQPPPYTPGVSLSDSLLLNEEEESKQLQTQVLKLSRRLQVVEQENQRRSQRELILYPLVFGYFFMKVFWWMFKPSRPY